MSWIKTPEPLTIVKNHVDGRIPNNEAINNVAVFHPQRNPTPDNIGHESLGHSSDYEKLYEGTEQPLDIAKFFTDGVRIHDKSIEHIFALFRPLVKPFIDEITRLHHDNETLIEQLRKQELFLDFPTDISQNKNYVLDYRGRKYAYIFCLTSLTLQVAGVQFTTNAMKFTPINFPRGTSITAVGVSDVSPVGVYIRLTDEPMSVYAELLASSASIPTSATLTNSGFGGANQIQVGSFSFAQQNTNIPATGGGNKTVKGSPGYVSGVLVLATGSTQLNITDGNAGQVVGIVLSTATVGQYIPMNAPCNTNIQAVKSTTTPVCTMFYS